MSLTARKIAHIKSKLAVIALNRTQQISLVLRNPDNSTTTLTVPAIWKNAEDADPTFDGGAGTTPGSPRSGQIDDIVSSFLQSDVSLTQLRACIYAFLPSPTPSELATRYVPTSITPKGIIPGGDRFVVTWSRQR